MLMISIITVSYNAEETIADCIESVATQTIQAEHILIDGLSKDRTMQIVDDHPNHFARVISERDQGVYDAMNKGIQHASGDIIGILNADDVYYSDNSLSVVSKLFSSTEIDACYGDLVYVEKDNINRVRRYWRSGDFKPEKFYWGWMPPHPTFFVRKDVYNRYGMFRLDLGSAADYELMLRFLLKEGVTVGYIQNILVKMRSGGVSNTSITNRLRANKMDRQAWSANGIKPYPWTTCLKPVRKLGQWLVRPGSAAYDF